MEDDAQIRIKKLIRVIILGFVFIVITWLFFFTASRGRVQIFESNNWQSISLQKDGSREALSISPKKGKKILGSGNYEAVLGRNNRSYRLWVKVPRWFGKVTVRPSTPQEAVANKLANNTRPLHLEKDGVLYSLGTGLEKSVVLHQKVASFPFVQNSTRAIPTQFKPILAYGDSFLGHTDNTEGGGQLVRYNPATGELTALGVPKTENIASGQIVVSSTGKGMVYFADGKFYYLDSLDSTPKNFNVDNNYKNVNGTAVITLAGTTLYVLQKQDGSGVRILAYNISTNKKELDITTPAVNFPVSAIAASPGSSYLVLQSSKDKLQAYDINNKKLLKPFSPENKLGNIYWLGGDKLVYLDSVSGIQQMKLPENEVSPLFSSATLAFIGLEHSGSRLFVTASVVAGEEVTDQIQNPVTVNPVVYGLDTTSGSQDTALVDYLPYVTGGYLLDDFNGNIFFAPLTNNLRDPLYSDPNALQASIDARISDAKRYMTQHNLPADKVTYLRDLRFNLDLYWARSF